MNDFYIFLDIDGVLTDIEFVKKNHQLGIKDTTKVFNSESVFALNWLFEKLNKIFDVNLVISSVWRKNMTETMHYFQKNNVDLSNVKRIFATNFVYDKNGRNDREAEIKNFLKSKSFENNENFLVIDDEAGFFDFEAKNKIVTNIYNQSLNFNMVKDWLKTFVEEYKNKNLKEKGF